MLQFCSGRCSALLEHKRGLCSGEREKNTKKGTWRSGYLLVLGDKRKDTLIEHSSKDQLYEINGPKKIFSFLHLASTLKIVKMC